MKKPRALEELDEYERELEELYNEGLIDDDEYEYELERISYWRAYYRSYYMLPPFSEEGE